MTSKRRIASSQIAAVLLLLLWATVALAHDPGLSATEVKLGREAIIAQVTFAPSDLEALLPVDQDHDRRTSGEEFDAARDALESLARALLELTVDGRVIEASRAEALLDDAGGVFLRTTYNHSGGSILTIRLLVLDKLPRGHRQFVSVRDQSEAIVTERLFDSASYRLDVRMSQTDSLPALASIRDFVLLGIEHILTGYDHIAFLFGLLLVGLTFKEAAAIISSFTVAHSFTLALAALEIVRVSPAVVEPLIAASIVIVGLENLRKCNMKRRCLLTFCFGLVHGFGFASVLQELRIGADAGAIVALFSFNSGVEIGQLAFAAVLLPMIWRLQRRERVAARLVAACSILIAIFGSYWLIERLQN
jgi:hydrogenase/urease accessory protein HupE